MAKLIPRQHEIEKLQYLTSHFPVTAILGARQCGKSTLARQFPYSHYFDLENPLDEKQLENPQLALGRLSGLIVIDEIQRIPELFPLIRYLVDTDANKKFLILGSASRDLIRQGSETLAGRIAFMPLAGFRFGDLAEGDMRSHWLRGGLPSSFLADSNQSSFLWRSHYITTYLERDIPQLGISIPARTLRRFWTMISHYHGQLLNTSELAKSFGISGKTVSRYLDILEGTFMIRLLSPWFANISKRLVKSPKLFLKDSGIFHSLQAIESENNLLAHNKLGASWEGYILEEAGKILGQDNLYFYRTQNGAELDLFWQAHGKNMGLEVKYGDAPSFTPGMRNVMQDLELAHLWIVYPGDREYPVHEKATVLPAHLLGRIGE